VQQLERSWRRRKEKRKEKKKKKKTWLEKKE
jgi:hypothetical protein